MPDWLERAASQRHGSVAIAAHDHSITYPDLHGRVGRLAAGLRRLGIGRGDVVAVHLPNMPEFLIAWLAINACGTAMQTVHLA